MSSLSSIAAEVDMRVAGLLDTLSPDVTTATRQVEEGLLDLQLDPAMPGASSISIQIDEGSGCSVFVGAYGQFEHLTEDAAFIVGFVEAVISGDLYETVWECCGFPFRANTVIQVAGNTYTHKWSLAAGEFFGLILRPLVKKRDITYEPYVAFSGRQFYK